MNAQEGAGQNGASTQIASLAHAVLLDVFDQRDAARRTEAIERIFTSDAHFIDHFGSNVGWTAIDAAVERLHARLPGFRITPVGAPELLAGAARQAWQFGPPSEPAKIRGSDTIIVREGRVSALLVFLDQPQAGGA